MQWKKRQRYDSLAEQTLASATRIAQRIKYQHRRPTGMVSMQHINTQAIQRLNPAITWPEVEAGVEEASFYCNKQALQWCCDSMLDTTVRKEDLSRTYTALEVAGLGGDSAQHASWLMQKSQTLEVKLTLKKGDGVLVSVIH
jgi:hypothetical protein